MQFQNLTMTNGVNFCVRSQEVSELSNLAKQALVQFTYIYKTVPGCSLVNTVINLFIINLTEEDIELLLNKNIISKVGNVFRIIEKS